MKPYNKVIGLPNSFTQSRDKMKADGAQYIRLLRFIGARLANEQDANELTQEAYLRLLRASDSKLIRDPAAYLFRIARNLLHEWYTSSHLPQETLDNLELADEGLTLEDHADIAQNIDRLEKVLQRLSPKCRAVVLMHRRDGMTYDEIAAELGISSSMVKKHLSRGLAQCRVSMRRYYEC